MLILLGASPAWRSDDRIHPLPNTLPGWTIAFLAATGDWVSRERLMTLLWPDAAPAEAQHNLRVDLHRTRALLSEWGVGERLEAERRRVRLLLPNDVSASRRTADAGRLEDPGPLLASMEFGGFPALREWFEIERAALAAAWRDAALSRIDDPGASPAVVLTWCQRLLHADPLDEVAMRRMLQVLRTQGRGAEADVQYEAYRDRLATEIGVEPSAAMRSLAPSLGTTPRAGPPPPEARGFVGRRLELAELRRRLSNTSIRLVTIVGPGGVGKSSLARQALAGLPAQPSWIDLQDLGDADAVAARIAQHLGVELRDGTDPSVQIAKGLGATPRWIALDNAEQVRDLPEFLARLLDAAPALTLLATSRRPIGLPGESLLPLEGLAVPDDDSRDVEAATAFDAVQLFDLRARAVQPGFAIERHVDAVVAIAEAVGGLPLALELAASWVRLLPPEAIARDLASTLDLLERDPASADRPARPEHASMHAVLDRSWSLLAPREQEALLALTVFAGGFVAAAAKAVADAPLPVLASLADKSLLQADDAGRFRMHPLVATDMAARASRDEAAQSARRDRHAEYLAHWLEDLPKRHIDDDRQIVIALGPELSNAQQAWRHAGGTGRHDLALRMLPAWRRYFEATGRYAEACRHLQVLLEQPAPATAARGVAHVRAARAHFLVRTNAPELARPLALEALRAADMLGDDDLQRICTSTLGGCALALGAFDEAHDWFERIRQLNLDAGDPRGVAAALNSLGLVASYRGHWDDALRYGAEAMAAYRSLGNAMGIARCWMNIAQAQVARSDWAQALEAAQSALQHAVAHDLSSIAMMSEFWMGVACLGLGDLDAGEKHLQRVRERCTATGNMVFGLKADYHLAHLAGRRGRTADAARGLLVAARSAQERGWTEDLLHLAIFLGELLIAADHRRAGHLLLRGVAQADAADGSDAVIRAQAEAALASMPADDLAPLNASPSPPRFERLARTMATSDTLDELAQRLALMTLD